MRPEQWITFRKAAKLEELDQPPVALIVDSPWIPGFGGISHLDYYFDPDIWFESNVRVMREFPDVIFFPSWWVEYGMVIEPSAAGGRILFRDDQPPGESPVLFRLEDVERLEPVNPNSDGFMPMALRQYRNQKQRIVDAGFTTPVVAARGPLCMASFFLCWEIGTTRPSSRQTSHGKRNLSLALMNPETSIPSITLRSVDRRDSRTVSFAVSQPRTMAASYLLARSWSFLRRRAVHMQRNQW